MSNLCKFHLTKHRKQYKNKIGEILLLPNSLSNNNLPLAISNKKDKSMKIISLFHLKIKSLSLSN